MKVIEILFFIKKGFFTYGEGDDEVECFADAIVKENKGKDVPSFSKEYTQCFDYDDAIEIWKVVDDEKYVICCEGLHFGSKAFKGTGLEIKKKLMKLSNLDWDPDHKLVEGYLIFPKSKEIRTKKLEKAIRSNPSSYKRVADWILEEEW